MACPVHNEQVSMPMFVCWLKVVCTVQSALSNDAHSTAHVLASVYEHRCMVVRDGLVGIMLVGQIDTHSSRTAVIGS